MPESVIKRLNELALADGRVKGKGEIYTKPTSYEQDGGAKSDLPDTIDSPVNDGVDPAILHLDIHDETDIVSERAAKIPLTVWLPTSKRLSGAGAPFP